MLEEWFVLKIYTKDERHIVLACEVEFDTFPTEREIENAIISEVGCDGVGEVIKRYRPKVPFA